MGKFMDWLRGDVVEEYGTEAAAKPVEKKKVSFWEERHERQEKSFSAYFEASNRASIAVKDHTPVGAALRIIQADAGHYEIQRLLVSSPVDSYAGLASYMTAEFWQEMSTEPVESYRSIQDGGRVMTFNIFDEAEAYLKRMCRKTPAVAEYDFPPLKKRVVKAEPPK